MYKLSEVLSKPVISLYEATSVGTAYNIFFDDKMQKLRLLEILTDSDNDVNKFVLPKNVIFPISDAVCVKNLSVVSSIAECQNCFNPINRPCFDTDGKYIGKVTDICFDKCDVLEIFANDKKILPKDVVKINSDLVLVRAEGSKYKPTPPAIKIKEKPEVQEFPEEVIPNKPIYEKKVDVPAKLGAGTVKINTANDDRFDFLIGKTVSKNLDFGFPVAADTVITRSLLTRVAKEGKLVTLALYAE